jgi:hypothetical protein
MGYWKVWYESVKWEKIYNIYVKGDKGKYGVDITMDKENNLVDATWTCKNVVWM